MKSVLEARYPFLVVTERSTIVGWCDVARREREGFRHTAELGMGLSAKMRGLGLGSRLLKAIIVLSRRRGIEKLELQVYASNVPARGLYRKFGFKVEGRRVRARKLDGRYDDVVLMALFLTRHKALKGTRRKRRAL
jgi:RimJ/RimL family protein N-acetyltransferase